MLVEGRGGRGIGMQGDEDASYVRFPVGMRVLAVDDDPICLKLLEGLLRRCDYHVTTTGQAITALKMLRENKDKFDLVISDVHMPDMDGFKLLELVGLEMDLPVIMLSANSDTKAVMKGITHGACDYLLKPVRIEELKNIWQHVIRRRKFDRKDRNHSMNGDEGEKVSCGTVEGRSAPDMAGPANANGKCSKKRKEQDDDDDDDFDENGHASEELSTQKRPRVVWSVELHRKFVAAVNQLGIEKAVPKRILDLMNVEKLTRENVASHLQKYRLYLKRISSVATQQANLAAALGANDFSCLHMGSLDGFGDFRLSSRSVELPKATLPPFQGGQPLGRLNTPTGLALQQLTSPRMIQLSRSQSTGNYNNDVKNLLRNAHPGNAQGNLIHGMPHSSEFDALKTNKTFSSIGRPTSFVDDSLLCPVDPKQTTCIRGFPNAAVASCSPSISLPNAPNKSLLEGFPTLSGGRDGRSSVSMATLNAKTFDVTAAGTIGPPKYERHTDMWQSVAPSAGFAGDTLPMDPAFNFDDFSSVHIPPISSDMEINPRKSSSCMAGANPLHESLIKRDLQSQTSSLDIGVQTVQCVSEGINENLNFSSFGRTGNHIGQGVDCLQTQLEEKQDFTHGQNVAHCSPLNSFIPSDATIDITNQSSGENILVCNRMVEQNMLDQMNGDTSFPLQQCDVGKPIVEATFNLKEDFLSEHRKLGPRVNPSICSSFDELMGSMIKREQDEAALVDGDLCDVFSLGACM